MRKRSGAETVCAIGGCEKQPCNVRGWCWTHYQRWRAHGDPNVSHKRGPKAKPILDRLADKFTVGDGCWEWTGTLNRDGYGSFQLGHGVAARAHRVLYEQLVGPIPEGLHIDHLCYNPCCVRPDHLEPVTQAENNRRAWDRRRAMNAEVA